MAVPRHAQHQPINEGLDLLIARTRRQVASRSAEIGRGASGELVSLASVNAV